MDGIRILRGESDRHGARKENVLLAQGKNGECLGSLTLHPFFDDKEPEHPHNLYLAFHTEHDGALDEPVKDLLLEHGLQRAAQIKHDAGQTKTRVYGCFLKDQKEDIAYFLLKGFKHDEGMLILERQDPTPPCAVKAPGDISIRAWRMETEDELQRFARVHRSVFPRHPYSAKRLLELKSLPGWQNLTAFQGDEIAGNIMVFARHDKDVTGYIEDLFVLKEWRRRGIGKSLLNAALSYFRAEGIHRVQLECWSANQASVDLYRAWGFAVIDETEIAVGRYV